MSHALECPLRLLALESFGSIAPPPYTGSPYLWTLYRDLSRRQPHSLRLEFGRGMCCVVRSAVSIRETEHGGFFQVSSESGSAGVQPLLSLSRCPLGWPRPDRATP